LYLGSAPGTDQIAGQPEVVLYADLGGILHLRVRTAERGVNLR
jgi:hypothetical protein